MGVNMVNSIQEKVDLWREDTGGESPVLLVKVRKGSIEDAVSDISSLDMEVLKQIGENCLRVSAGEGALEKLEDLELVEDVEIEGNAETLEEGSPENFLDHRIPIL
jgi:hypothetical protein